MSGVPDQVSCRSRIRRAAAACGTCISMRTGSEPHDLWIVLKCEKKFGYFTVFDPFQIGASKRSLRYCQVHNYLWRAFIWCKQNRPSIQCLGGCNCCAYKTEMLVLFLVPFLAPVSLYQFEIARCKNSVDLLYVVNKLLATWQLWNDAVTIFWL